MSIVQLDPPPIQPMLMVVPWHDPVVDTVGHDVRSVYVELFWLNILGPSATWILRRLVQGLDRYPLGYEVDLGDMAGSLGLAYTAGNSNPFSRALQRCSMFGVHTPSAVDSPSDAAFHRSPSATCNGCPRAFGSPTSIGCAGTPQPPPWPRHSAHGCWQTQ
jgi:hypothetical protein